MKFLGILTLLLITSSSVLCRRIRRQDIKAVAEKELSDLPKLREETIENTSQKLELERINATTPTAENPQENAAVFAQVESGSGTSFDFQGKLDRPISKKRIQKMLQKAILQIITGNLTTADMRLLKSLNYDAEQVRKIREEELETKKNIPEKIDEKKTTKNRMNVHHEKPKIEPDLEEISPESNPGRENGFDYEAYNNQATRDYEYASSNFETTNGSWDESVSEHDDRNKNSTETVLENNGLLEQNVVFTISYNDSEFDSSSEENPNRFGEENHQLTLNGTGNSFTTAATSANSSPAPVDDRIDTLSELYNITRNYFSTTENTVEENNEVDSQTIPSRNQNEDLKVPNNGTQLPEGHSLYKNDQKPFVGEENRSGVSPSVATLSSTRETPNVTNNFTSSENHTVLSTRYKGLKWVQDNVYQVIPEYIDFVQSENEENETTYSSYDDASYLNLDDGIIKNLTNTEDLGPVEDMANDAPDSIQLPKSNANNSVENFANSTTYQQMAATQRRAQRQKTEDDIKSRVLLVTGRLNSTSNSNPLQPRREKLAMFSPTCGMPRNTDADMWQNPYSMNMQFLLNLTLDQHLVAARLRLFKLPQESSTTITPTIVDGVENDEKKIRISVYYYTRFLKKHRTTRKRLIDSKVASLTTTGEHLALDVKDAVKHWRSAGSRNTNHGLLVLVEDQEGRPLQPSHYIQTPNCHNVTDLNLQDEKAYQRVPALYIRACTRYVRLVENRVITYEFCEPHPGRVSFQEETNQY